MMTYYILISDNTGLIVEIGSYVVSILVGYLAFRYTKADDKKIDLAIGLMVTVLCFFITSFVSMRFFHLETIKNNQEFIEKLQADNESVRIAEDLTNAKGVYNQKT